MRFGMTSLLKTTAFILLILLTSGCIVNKKLYDDLLTEKVKTDGELEETSSKLMQTEKENTELGIKVKNLNQENADLRTSLGDKTNAYDKLREEHTELEEYYNNLLSNRGKLAQDLAEQRKQLITAREELELERLKNEELGIDLREREAKLNELETILEQKEKAVNDLKTQISSALTNFKDTDLRVEIKNGKVYVSLAEQLLFPTFSIQVDKKGQEALKQLAKVLKQQPDINVLVEGHTDNVPISKTSDYMRNNWDLSVLRANSIVAILTKEGVKPLRITTAGRGEFNPVADNKNENGRKLNRRTEIILTPELDELFKILETN